MWLKRVKNLSIITALMITCFAAGLSLRPIVAFGADKGGFSVLLHVYDLIQNEFLERATITDDTLEQGAIVGMIDSLGDPYTRYMDPKAFREMKEEREGEFSGIGIQIGIKHKQLTVIAPLEDTPAYKAGLKSEDAIIAIDKKPTKDISIDEAVTLIRGKQGTTVTLTIMRAGTANPFDVPIVRGNIQTKAVKYKMMEDKTGYLRLSSFMNNDAPDEMEKALKALTKQGMKSLILDLRSNPGGLLQNAIDIGSMFIQKGTIVQVVDKSSKKEFFKASGNLLIPSSMPMVTLIDGGSASASEILAGALKDHKRATLIGLKTFGKGLVQTVHSLPNGGGVSITTNKYLTSNGNDIDKKGIEPDILVELQKTENEDTAPKDVQLEKVMEFLKK